LRGAFLAGGYISNPETSYHFEISTPYYTLAKSLESFMKKLDFPAKTVVRKSSYVVYMKGSEHIESLLCHIGANSSAFTFMDAKIFKEMNNLSNRLNNTKLHNLEKTLNKSVEQVTAINKIKSRIGLDSLESDRAFIAKLRIDYPDKSLNELVNLCDNKFSRSSLNRKLNKLTEIASKLGE
jgi:DNA-binding protein WhiA